MKPSDPREKFRKLHMKLPEGFEEWTPAHAEYAQYLVASLCGLLMGALPVRGFRTKRTQEVIEQALQSCGTTEDALDAGNAAVSDKSKMN